METRSRKALVGSARTNQSADLEAFRPPFIMLLWWINLHDADLDDLERIDSDEPNVREYLEYITSSYIQLLHMKEVVTVAVSQVM